PPLQPWRPAPPTINSYGISSWKPPSSTTQPAFADGAFSKTMSLVADPCPRAPPRCAARYPDNPLAIREFALSPGPPLLRAQAVSAPPATKRPDETRARRVSVALSR